MNYYDIHKVPNEMPEELNWNWMEGIFRRIPIPYPIVSVTFGFTIFLVYLVFMFSNKIEDFQWGFYSGVQVLSFCVLISYLLMGIQYICNEMRSAFQRLEFIPGSEKYTVKPCDQLKERLGESRSFLLTLMIIIFPPIIIAYMDPAIFSCSGSSFCDYALYLTFFNYWMYFFSIYLQAYILWIILNFSLTLIRLEKNSYRSSIRIDAFSADKIGGLGYLRNFILKIIIYYSVGISLTIISYVDPSGFGVVSYEILFYIVLLLVGLIILIEGLQSVQRLFRDKINDEIRGINEEYQKLYRRSAEIVSKDYLEKNEANLQFILRSMEFFHKERADREQILNDNESRYNLTILITGVISLILPLLTLFEKLNGYGLIKMVLDAFNISIDTAAAFSLLLQLIIHYR